MGWASGSRIFSEIIAAVKPHVADKDARKSIYRPIIEAFENDDWDTQDECLDEDEAYDEVMREIHPDWFDEEDEEDCCDE